MRSVLFFDGLVIIRYGCKNLALYIRDCVSLCLSDETLKAIGPFYLVSSSSSHICAGQRLTPHNRTLEVRPGRITKKLELKYDYDC